MVTEENFTLRPKKYRLVFDEVRKQYRIQERIFYFWYYTLGDRYDEHELYTARRHMTWLRQNHYAKKIKKNYIILDY